MDDRTWDAGAFRDALAERLEVVGIRLASAIDEWQASATVSFVVISGSVLTTWAGFCSITTDYKSTPACWSRDTRVGHRQWLADVN